MATISNATLDIVGVDATTVKVTVSYDLVPNQTEKLAGTVFQENIVLLGDHSGTTVFTFADGAKPAQFAVNSSTSTVSRSRDHKIPKSTLNEDPGLRVDDAEDLDQIQGQITIAYAANAPSTSALPPATATNTHTGAWV